MKDVYALFSVPIVRNQLIANTVLVAVAFVLVILRFTSRKLRHANFWWDELCVVSSLIHTIGMLAMQYQYAHVGMGYHRTQVPPENLIYILKMLIAYQVIYYNAIVLAKLSYLFLYLRIFVLTSFRYATWACMACAGAYWLGSTLQVFLTCHPFAANWNSSLPGAHCADRNVAFSTIGSFNLVTDVMIMILPFSFIYKLQMSLMTKLGLSAIFCVGLFISAITIIRIRVMTTIDFQDLPYSMPWAAFWSVTEPALGVANACVPMMRPLLRMVFPRLFSTPHTYNHSRKQQNGSSRRSFRKIHDGEYPLTPLDKGTTTSDVLTGDQNGEDYSDEYLMNYGNRTQSGFRYVAKSDGINVTNEWSVSH